MKKIIALLLAAVIAFAAASCTHEPALTKAEQIEKAISSCTTDEVILTEVPEFAPDGEFSGIDAVSYVGLDMGGSHTKIFAYTAFPDNADETTPAIVLVHGGGGHAFLEWVKAWLDRGYSVIAPDVTGFFPTEKNAGATTDDGLWEHGLNGVFAEEGFTAIPDNDGMSKCDGELDGQWMYHAVAAVSKAISLLTQSGKADPAKIGVMGISWGGVITSICLGYDQRPAFAVPVYGSAYLGESLSYMSNMFSDGAAKELWSAEDRLYKVSCPILWLCSNEDGNFSLNSNSMSYQATADNSGTRLSIVTGLKHSHESAWERNEPFAFADEIVNGGDKMPYFTSFPTKSDPTCTAVGASRVQIYYLTEEMTYSLEDESNPLSTKPDQQWIKSSLSNDGGSITCDIPEDAVMYYVNITSSGMMVSSPIVTVDR